MKVEVRDLVSQAEIAWRLHVNPAAVSNWRRRNIGFPDPIDVAGIRGKIYLWPQVKKWAIKTGRPYHDVS